MRLQSRWCITLALAVLPAQSAMANEDWQFDAMAATGRTTRGAETSDRQPSASFSASWYPGSGIFAGTSASTIRIVGTQTTGTEVTIYGGYGWRFTGDWSVQAMLSHYQFVHVPQAARYNYDEFVLTTGWRDSVFASVAVSPNTGFGPSPSTGGGSSPSTFAISYDLVGRLPLVHGWTATAGVGYYDLRRVFGFGYVYGNAGLTYQFRTWQFDLSYIATSHQAKARLGPGAANRWVADVIWHF
ncbi:hypothetical protein BZY94_40895 [Burkholderia territorii]|nr:hypothetical protein BZY94_40895 [Burkholderia territorii]